MKNLIISGALDRCLGSIFGPRHSKWPGTTGVDHRGVDVPRDEIQVKFQLCPKLIQKFLT